MIDYCISEKGFSREVFKECIELLFGRLFMGLVIIIYEIISHIFDLDTNCTSPSQPPYP